MQPKQPRGRPRVARIPLYRRDGSIRTYALINAVDLPMVESYRWFAVNRAWNLLYAVARPWVDGKRIQIWMHRVILGLPSGGAGEEVDHINHDGLDNRRVNIRVVTHKVNMQNRRPNTPPAARLRRAA